VKTTADEKYGQIFTVSKLTSEIKNLLEDNFSFVWVTGEISNLRGPGSGHLYFALKDEYSQISSVMFRGQVQQLKFLPRDGLSITGLGRISVYEPRGTYQIILEYLEPAGLGALQAAFQQLKERLQQEGLFDPEHKVSIPLLPKKIAVVTSPTGAVIHDILNVLNRRFHNIPILIYPVKVQGENSETEIVQALDDLGARADIDVIILARGGGSLEDFQAFNSERVARGIFRCRIPVVSAVGHETDYTISDFVADLRAPTPSAAAELVAPVKLDLQRKCIEMEARLMHGFKKTCTRLRNELLHLSNRLDDPRKELTRLFLRTDDLTERMNRAVLHLIQSKRNPLEWRVKALCSHTPRNVIDKGRSKLEKTNCNIINLFNKNFYLWRSDLKRISGKLHALSPRSILERGYSITLLLPGQSLVRESGAVIPGDSVQVILSKGSLMCEVRRKINE